MTRKSFILYLDMLSVLDEMNEQQAGRLFKAIKAYHLRQTLEPDQDDDTGFEELVKDFVTRLAFAPFKAQFDRDTKKYDEVVERNRRNGAKGGRPKKQNPENPSGFLENPLKPKKADNDIIDSIDRDNIKPKNKSPIDKPTTITHSDKPSAGVLDLGLEEPKKKKSKTPPQPPPPAPTLEEIKAYFLSQSADTRLEDWEPEAEIFFNNFNATDWVDAVGRKIKRWDSRANRWIFEKEQRRKQSQPHVTAPITRTDTAADGRQQRQNDIASYVARNLGNNAGVPGGKGTDMPI